jgi:hypothetical protein
MKRDDISLSLKPYEATWFELTETDSGYVVYNYPSRWNDGETKNPLTIIVKKNQFTCISFSDTVMTYTFENVEKRDDIYFFRVENFYEFKWIDKEKHIAQWIDFYGDGTPITNYFYIDSVYNVYPIIDYEW